MKHVRLWVTLGILGLLAAVMRGVFLHAQNPGDQGFSGGSYVTTVKDSAGNFASRGVITLHADQTMSVIDSGQGGPTYYFTNQLGSWKPDGNRGIVGRTIDFDVPQNPGSVVRGDFTISFAQDRSQVTGTITVTTFPLEANPFDGGGTILGTFSFEGELIKH